MRGKRDLFVLLALIVSMTSSCASTLEPGAVAIGEYTAEPSVDPGAVTLFVGNETEVPITGVQVVVDGQLLHVDLAGRLLDLDLSPGEHDLELDLVLRRGDPQMIPTLPRYEARVQGATQFGVSAGCHLTLRATVEGSPLMSVRPAIRFHHVLDCSSSAPISDDQV